MRCCDCPGNVEGYRRGPRCKACTTAYQNKIAEERRISKLASQVNLRHLLPRHKGKR